MYNHGRVAVVYVEDVLSYTHIIFPISSYKMNIKMDLNKHETLPSHRLFTDIKMKLTVSRWLTVHGFQLAYEFQVAIFNGWFALCFFLFFCSFVCLSVYLFIFNFPSFMLDVHLEMKRLVIKCV